MQRNFVLFLIRFLIVFEGKEKKRSQLQGFQWKENEEEEESERAY